MLKDKVAVVTGASRGAGRAIAAVLGEAGATVYVTGRTMRGGAAVDGLTGTVEDTAEEVTSAVDWVCPCGAIIRWIRRWRRCLSGCALSRGDWICW